MNRLLIILGVALVLLANGVLNTAHAQGGGTMVPISAEERLCIDPNTHRVWLKLRRLITQRETGWIRADRSVAVLIRAAVQTASTSSSPSVSYSYPLMREYIFGDHDNDDQVSVPVGRSVVAGLPLTEDDHTYATLAVDLKLLNNQNRTRWGSALKALGDITRRLTFPNSPVAQAGSYLLRFANSAIHEDLAREDMNNQVDSAGFELTFDLDGDCDSQGFQKTGTIAVVQSTGAEDDDPISVSEFSEYCWYADYDSQSFFLRAARRETGISCDERTRYRDKEFAVRNDYAAFLVMADEVDGVDVGLIEDSSRESVYRRNARELCRLHGIADDECFR